MPIGRTFSIMVNTACGRACRHCSLPRHYRRSVHPLSPSQWAELLDHWITVLRPRVVSLAAREPLHPDSWDRTAAILRTAKQRRCVAGLVTNGDYAEKFFREGPDCLRLDFLDVSIEGLRAVDDRIRGAGHFDIVEKLIRGRAWASRTRKLLLSFTLNAWNAKPSHLRRFLEWASAAMERPRLVVLVTHINERVAPDLALSDAAFLRALDILVPMSAKFDEIFLDVFPTSLAGLARLTADRTLPGEPETLRDDSGLLWGHVAERLFVRYQNKRDLARYHLRISPEGWAIRPEAVECMDYLESSYGNLRRTSPRGLESRILRDTARRDTSVPAVCSNRPCRVLCYGENDRCEVLARRKEPTP